MPISRFYGLDLLRTMGMAAVLLHHLPDRPSFLNSFDSHSWMAMNLFFVLSGYLIASQYLTLSQARPHGCVRDFYLRRFFKLVPVYAFVLLGYWAAGLLPSSDSLPLWRYLTLTQNFGMKASDPLSESWTVAVEAHFYIAFPLLALFFQTRKKYFPLFFLSVLILGVVLRDQVWMAPGRPSVWTALHVPTYCRLDGLLCGVAVALLQRFREPTFRLLSHRPNQVLSLGLLILAAVIWGGGDRAGYFCNVWGFPLTAFAFALLVLSGLNPRSLLNRCRLPGVSALAAISYSIYLTHRLAYKGTLGLLAWTGREEVSSFERAGICAAAAVGLGALVYGAIERPFLKWRERFSR